MIITISAVRKTESRFGYGFEKPNRSEPKKNFENRQVGFPRFSEISADLSETERNNENIQ